MSVWIEDAQMLTEPIELEATNVSLLQKTPDVNDFLANGALKSGALIAPKGFGKTLTMKLKRMALQKDGYKCLPQDVIVDRPRDRPPILAADIVSFLEKSKNWETAWQIAFSIAVIKSNRDDPVVDTLTKLLLEKHQVARNLLENPTIETPFEALHAILLPSRSEIYEIIKIAADFTGIFQRVNKKIAIFIDNIDEYLENYINYDYRRKGDTHSQYLSLWHNGQIGAWHALRRLNGINPHIRIFITMRKEAYHYAAEKESLFNNLCSFSKELRYTREDIVEIIERRIASEPKENLVDADRASDDVFRRFVGRNAEVIENSVTGKLEHVKDYWLRHCALRPRDAISIGKAISSLGPRTRNVTTVRSAINKAAAERTQSLFTEVRPFFDGLIPEIFHKIIPSNVLTKVEISKLAQDYQKIAVDELEFSLNSTHHPFCALYALGLLGVVGQDRSRRGQLIQTFSPVGQVPFGKENILPVADYFLLHPAFTDYIQERNVSFLRATNRQNVIGDMLEWRSEQEIRFVIVGDMRGYRKSIMEKPGQAQTFRAYWEKIFRAFTKELDFADSRDGDKVVLADRNPSRVIEAAQDLMSELKKSQYNVTFRMGGHSDFWRLSNDPDGSAQPEISGLLGVAARIEPHARPGDILVSSQFLEHARGLNLDVSRLNFVQADDTYGFPPEVFTKEKGLLISKPQKEDEEYVQPYFIGGD